MNPDNPFHNGALNPDGSNANPTDPFQPVSLLEVTKFGMSLSTEFEDSLDTIKVCMTLNTVIGPLTFFYTAEDGRRLAAMILNQCDLTDQRANLLRGGKLWFPGDTAH